MKITDNFDSGNITVVDSSDISNIQLNIKPDNQSDFFQWFHFRVQTQAYRSHTFHIQNAGQSSYVEGWSDYHVCASYDRENWFRVDTQFEDNVLSFELSPEFDSVYFAYFTPYSYERHQDLLHEAQIAEECQLVDLGETVQGRDMSLLVIGQPDEDKKNIWITGRQHPGETMAEWYIEGLLNRLLDDEDGTAKALLEKAVFYIVPNMNPDGSVLGNLRTNAAGRNLNREWQTPCIDASPEVYLVREKMLATGVDMFLDIHGDEAIPYNFVAGCEGIPSYDERHKNLETTFKAAYALITPEFQDVHTYPKDEAGKANMTVACTWVGERFNCLAYTVEMPFKDNHDLPDAVYGWSDIRSMKFGHDVLPAILAVVDKL